MCNVLRVPQRVLDSMDQLNPSLTCLIKSAKLFAINWQREMVEWVSPHPQPLSPGIRVEFD